MVRHLRTLPVLVLAFATACSSTATNDPFTQSNAAINGAKPKLKAAIRIVIPKHKHRRRGALHGQYVADSTKSIAIAVTPSAGGVALNFNADLTPVTNPSCIADYGPIVCTLTIRLAAGSYSVNVATYDGLLAGGNAPNNPPTGNKLSANQHLPFVVVRGKQNELHVTLDGVPASVALVPGTGSTLAGNDASGFTLARCSQPAQNVDVYGVDADKNYIVGAGAPALSLTSNDATNLPVTAKPNVSNPNQFTLTPSTYPAKSTVVQLTAGVTPAAGSGGTAKSANIDVTFGSSTCYSISEYSTSVSASSSSGPDGIATDGTNLWFTVGGSVVKMTAAGAVVGTYSVGGDLVSLAFDGSSMWVVNGGGNPGSVTKVSATGTMSGPYTVGAYPGGIAFDGTNMWVANSGGTTVTKLSPTGATVGTYSAGSEPSTIAFDGTNMWATNYITSGTVTELSLAGSPVGSSPFAVGDHPGGIGFDGTYMWVANLFGNSLTVLSSTGTTLHTYDIPTSDSRPEYITQGSDGAMWFTEINGNNIGRVTSDGTFTEIPVPTASSQPLGIVKGPDGNIWFTEKAGDKVGTVIAH